MGKTRMTPRRCNCNGVEASTVLRRDSESITQSERGACDGFAKGSYWAAAVLGLSFGSMLAIGILMGWC